MIGYILALLPLYIFVLLPVSQLLGLSLPFSSTWSSSSSSLRDGHDESGFNASFIALEDPSLVCAEHTYSTHILSREPLVLYLEGWLSETEIEELLEISKDQFQTSRVSTGPSQFIDPLIRLSEVATLPRTPTVQCIENRARALQGWGRPSPQSSALGWSVFGQPSHGDGAATGIEDRDTAQGGQAQAQAQAQGLMLERLKIQRYGPAGHYSHHYDWHGAGSLDRVSSFMVYVDANCTGGGTAFPRLQRPSSRRWCGFIECAGEDAAAQKGQLPLQQQQQQQQQQEGVVFKPVRGNAVFWENLRPDGSGYVETWHAGLPVETGVKVGLNIWTWYRF